LPRRISPCALKTRNRRIFGLRARIKLCRSKKFPHDWRCRLEHGAGRTTPGSCAWSLPRGKITTCSW
jgi:hypothetical protein